MNQIFKKIVKKIEKNNTKILVYTSLTNNLSDSWNEVLPPYQVWQEESRNLKLR